MLLPPTLPPTLAPALSLAASGGHRARWMAGGYPSLLLLIEIRRLLHLGLVRKHQQAERCAVRTDSPAEVQLIAVLATAISEMPLPPVSAADRVRVTLKLVA